MARAPRGDFQAIGHPLSAKLRMAKQRSTGHAYRQIANYRLVLASGSQRSGTTEVFVSPCVTESAAAAAILVHELCHHGHRAATSTRDT
jgi:hypothetical protein